MDACFEAMDDGPGGWAWQDEDQLHVTLRFIGAVERGQAEDIAAALETLHSPPVGIALAGVGRFDHRRSGALFARVAPKEPLAALHKKVDRLLVNIGLEPERRTFLPHITLARRRARADDPTGWLERRAGLATDYHRIERVTLYESHLGQHGATYEPVARYPLPG